jgi:tetratricopeptide (TPR) repeat protein
MHCLGEKLRPVAALATELSRATKDTAGRAAQAAAALPPLDDCGVEQVLAAKLRPPPPEIAPKVSALRERLASGQAQLWLGRYPEGLQIVDGATAEAKVLAYRQVQAEILQLRGALLESLTRFTEAEIAFQEGIAAAEAAGSPELALRGWVELGYVQGFFLTRAEDSGRSLAHAQAVLEAVGRAPRAEARLLEVRGLLLKNAGKLDEAAEALGKSLAINEERLGKEDVALASTLLRLSETVREQGDQERSLHLSERARALREKALGESHPGVAEALALSGFTLFELGRFDESEADFRRALVIIEARSGKDHPNAGNALSGLAGIYIYTGRFADALPLKERALAISAKTYGPDSPDVATDNEHLATIYLGLNRLDEAAGHAEKCVELMKAMGMDNPYRVTGLSVLADVRRRQGKLAESRALFEEAGAIERKATGEARPELVEIEQNLGRLALLEGKAPAALPHLETSARLAKKLLPESHPGRVPPLVALGEVYGALKRPGDAVAPLEEALASPAPRGALGEDRARAELGLGRALWSTGKDKERAQDLAKAAKRDLGALPRTPEISKLLEEAEKLLAMMQKSA